MSDVEFVLTFAVVADHTLELYIEGLSVNQVVEFKTFISRINTWIGGMGFHYFQSFAVFTR